MSFFSLHEPECPCIDLSEDERVVAGILFWARNRAIEGGLPERINKEWLVGPSGLKSKGFWFPTGTEACDYYLPNHTVWTETPPKRRPDPWAQWKHCRTLGHCTYLVRHRAPYVSAKLGDRLIRMVTAFKKRVLPIVITEDPTRKNTMEREFAIDMLSGTFGNLIEFMEGGVYHVEHSTHD